MDRRGGLFPAITSSRWREEVVVVRECAEEDGTYGKEQIQFAVNQAEKADSLDQEGGKVD